jgi:hypothetical protein
MRIVFILFVVFAFCGCAMQKHKAITKSQDQLKLENKGVLTIKEETFWEGLDPLASHISAVFRAVDSKELPSLTWDGYPEEIEVEAGEREIEYSCSGTIRMWKM